LPKGNTPYEVWFGRKPPTYEAPKESACRARAVLEGVDETSASEESSTIEVIEVREEDEEDSLFVDKEAELEEAAEEMILSKLTKRVAEHVRKQQERMVKKANAKALEYDIQEIATLQIPKQYRFSTEMARIPVRVLEKTSKVLPCENILLAKANKKQGYRLTTKYGELTTLWPHGTLNKVASQATYPGLPTTGAVYKKDKITLPKAVVIKNNRLSIALVQKAGRASEKAKKRAAVEQAREDEAGKEESGDQEVTRAAKSARVTIKAPRRSGRHVQ
jgi:hypothetical protein